MTCPLTFAKESLAINPVDSLESDSSAWYTGQISRCQVIGPKLLVVRFPCRKDLCGVAALLKVSLEF